MADAPLAFGLGLPFQEQLDFFRQKLNLPTDRWDDIWKAAHDRAFIVAGAAEADLLNDLRQAVDKAVTQGMTLRDFRKEFDAIVTRHGWHGWTGEGTDAGEAWRTRVIYETNIRASYAAGRYRQLTSPAMIQALPYWRYVHNDSVRHPRPLHKLWGDMRLTLRYNDPFWATHFPPNGWGCRCRIVATDAPGEGDATTPPEGWDKIDPKTKEQVGIDRGWGYEPGANADTPLRDLVDAKLFSLDAPIGAAMAEVLEPRLAAERAQAFVEFVNSVLSQPPRGQVFTVGALKPEWVQKAQELGVAPATAEIAVRDADIWHTFRSTKAYPLDLAWYKDLPNHLETAGAVLLDSTHPDAPAFLLIYDMGDAAKVVVRINYRIKKRGMMNIVETGRTLDAEALDTIRNEIGRGYMLVEGSL